MFSRNISFEKELHKDKDDTINNHNNNTNEFQFHLSLIKLSYQSLVKLDIFFHTLLNIIYKKIIPIHIRHEID